MELAIETIRLTKRYGSLTAVDKLDLRVKANTVHGFLGPDGIASNLVAYVLNQSADVTYFKISPISSPPYYLPTPLYTEPLSLILARSIIVAAAYIMVFMFISWFALKRAEVLE